MRLSPPGLQAPHLVDKDSWRQRKTGTAPERQADMWRRRDGRQVPGLVRSLSLPRNKPPHLRSLKPHCALSRLLSLAFSGQLGAPSWSSGTTPLHAQPSLAGPGGCSTEVPVFCWLSVAQFPKVALIPWHVAPPSVRPAMASQNPWASGLPLPARELALPPKGS